MAGAVKTSGSKGVHVIIPVAAGTPRRRGRRGDPGAGGAGRAAGPGAGHDRVRQGPARGQGLPGLDPGRRRDRGRRVQPAGAAGRAGVVPGGLGRAGRNRSARRSRLAPLSRRCGYGRTGLVAAGAAAARRRAGRGGPGHPDRPGAGDARGQAPGTGPARRVRRDLGCRRSGSSPGRRRASAGSGRSPRWSGATRWPPPPATRPRSPTWWRSTATRSCRSGSTSPTGRRTSPRSPGRTSGSVGWTSWSTTPATATSASSRRSPRRRRGRSWRPTSSARSGSPRRRCRSCGSRAAGTSSRCPRSAGSPRSLGRDLPRLQVGAGGHHPGAGAGGRAVRHPRHRGRAGRVRDRLGRSVRRASPSGCRRTRRTTRRCWTRASAGRHAR